MADFEQKWGTPPAQPVWQRPSGSPDVIPPTEGLPDWVQIVVIVVIMVVAWYGVWRLR